MKDFISIVMFARDKRKPINVKKKETKKKINR